MEDAPQIHSPPPLPVPVRRPKLAITGEQVETFANLMGETEESVARRLRRDPGLVPFVAAAADARRARQRTGRNLMILGFSTVGLGGTVGLLGNILSGPGYPGESPRPNEKSTQSHFTTDVIGVFLVGLGLITATYGIVKVAAQTDLETEAVGRYQGSPSAGPPIFSPGISRALSVDSRGSTFSLSLGSFTF
jgi:hypothetical protein